MIKKGVLLLRNNKLDEISFRNIINTACKVKEFDWVLEFLEKYNRFIIPEQRKNAYNFNLANLYFNQGKFEETITLLRKIKFTTSIYSLNTKLILIKSYYEVNLDKLLFSFLESFRIFILRNKQIPKYQKESCFNFVHFLHKIANLRATHSIIHKNDFLKKAAAIETQIAQYQSPLIGKDWLLEKFEEISQ